MLFFERFETLARENNTSPNAVAKQLGISSGSVTAWKNGTAPSIDKAIQIASYFGVSVDDLLGEPDLVRLYYNGVRNWASNEFFKPEETKRIEEHFQDLLLRYQELVNAVCSIRTGMGDVVDIEKIVQATSREIESIIYWVANAPEYFFGKYRTKDVIETLGTEQWTLLAVREFELLQKIRKLNRNKFDDLAAFLDDDD